MLRWRSGTSIVQFHGHTWGQSTSLMPVVKSDWITFEVWGLNLNYGRWNCSCSSQIHLNSFLALYKREENSALPEVYSTRWRIMTSVEWVSSFHLCVCFLTGLRDSIPIVCGLARARKRLWTRHPPQFLGYVFSYALQGILIAQVCECSLHITFISPHLIRWLVQVFIMCHSRRIRNGSSFSVWSPSYAWVPHIEWLPQSGGHSWRNSSHLLYHPMLLWFLWSIPAISKALDTSGHSNWRPHWLVLVRVPYNEPY